MERDAVFIGHANPEDNEFTSWIASKLIQQGFKVKADIELLGGESDYWAELQNSLDNEACKYLLVFSKSSFSKQGVIDEWEQARSVARKTNFKDFIMILKLDDVAFDARIGTASMNHFRFDKGWGSGLKALVKKLENDNVPRPFKDQQLNPLNDWLKNKYSTSSGIEKKKEAFFSNWLAIDGLPEKTNFYEYSNDEQARVIATAIHDFPVINHDRYVIGFIDSVPTRVEGIEFEINHKNMFSVDTRNAIDKVDSGSFPNGADFRRFLVRILKAAIHNYLIAKGLSTFSFANNTIGFYHERGHIADDTVHFQYKGKKTWKVMVGEFVEVGYWHYCVSVHPLFFPELCYSIRSHLVFTIDGKTAITKSSRYHKLRRRKGKGFYNKEWRMLLLGFLASLKNEGDLIKIPLATNACLVLRTTTIEFMCNVGYEEPQGNGRIVPIDYPDDDEEDEDEDEIGGPEESFETQDKDEQNPEV